MDGPVPPSASDAEASPPGIRWFARIAAVYVVALMAATYPMFLTFGSRISGDVDQLQHLWIMRANRANLLQGRFRPIAPGLQYPIGAPLGNFSPLHLESLLFVVLDPIFGDAASYNILWLVGMVGTGLGTAYLAWYLLRDRLSATFAGLVAMLSGPMMMHALGHLELIHMEWFPVFLVAWMRFVDGPSRRSLAFAAMSYVLVAMSAAYFAILSLIPATLYLLWSVSRGGFRGIWPWIKARFPWGLGFLEAAGPPLLLLFGNHLWAATHGFGLKRSRLGFETSGAPLWGYATPTFVHRSRPLRLFDVYHMADGYLNIENASYLGLVTLGLIAIAALSRARFRNARFWWSSTLLLIVLSCGTSWTVAGFKVPLPALWLWDFAPIYRMLRTPARFNLLAGVSAAVLAGAGLRALLAKLPPGAWRGSAFIAIASLAVLDLSIWLPNPPIAIPAPPNAYTFIKTRNPGAKIVDVPQCQTGYPSRLSAVCTYWQSRHLLTTTAGYSGVSNVPFDQLMYEPSPFALDRLAQANFPDRFGGMTLETVVGADFRDYAWLYLTTHKLDYVVLHQSPDDIPAGSVHLGPLKALLAESLVGEDSRAAVYDRRKLREPLRPTILCLDGWLHRGAWGRAVAKEASLAVFIPDPSKELVLTLDATSLRKRKNVRIHAGNVTIARWEVVPDAMQHLESPPFRLPAGLGVIRIESDRESVPDLGDLPEQTRTYSLRIASISLR